ncbi:MAG: amidohydrolase family protein, partial [Methyloligellaceae bacterium]
LDPETTYICAKWMLLEALRGGFTTINNFAIINREKTEAIHRASLDTGVKVISSTGAVNKAAYDNVTGKKFEFKQIDEALRRAADHLDLCRQKNKITPSLCVSGVQGASKELIDKLSTFCRENSALFQIHANEHIPEVHSSVVEHGRRPTEYIADCNGLGDHTILHHATLVTESEIELIRSTNTGVSYNPVASVWKGDAVCPALAYLERGVRIGLGTDSTRSDGFRLLEAAEACQRIEFGMRVNDFSSGAGWNWVDCASRGSADVSGLGQQTGQLAKGFAADFLVLDTELPEVLPSWDFTWELVRFYNRDQIRAVVIDGDLVMGNGRATGWDQDQFLREALPKAIETVETAPIVRRHGPSAAHRSGIT